MKFKLLHAFLIAYFTFLIINVSPHYLDADEGSHALTSLFFNRLIKDWFASPTISPTALYNYATSYYVHYPKFTFIYGPLFPLLAGFIFLFTGPSILVLRVIEVILSALSLMVFYYAMRNWFDERRSLLAMIILATSNLFITYSLKVMLDIPCFLLFNLGFYYFTKSFIKGSKLNLFLSGLFLGLSILTKEIALLFSMALVFTALLNYKKLRYSIILMIAGLAVFTLPYFTFLYLTGGGLEVILSYPQRQAYYGAENLDPQWWEFMGWIYFPMSVSNNYSVIFAVILTASVVYFLKRRSPAVSNMLLLLLFTYLIITFINDKNDKLMLLGLGYCAGIVSLGFNEFFEKVTSKKLRVTALFTLIFMTVISFPFIIDKPFAPMSSIAEELIQSCPNCTILIASETGRVYSSYLMFESLLRDENVSLRFIRPTAFASINAPELIINESVNRVVVIGDFDYLMTDDEIKPYYNQVQFITNKYDVLKSYESDFVGRIFIYDTGINVTRGPPYCVNALAIGMGFCTNLTSPRLAFI